MSRQYYTGCIQGAAMFLYEREYQNLKQHIGERSCQSIQIRIGNVHSCLEPCSIGENSDA